MSREKKMTCYHGTTKENAEKIIKEQVFFHSDRENEWLGRGIYFFDDKADTLWWNSHSRFDGQEMVILEVTLEFPEDTWLDLDNKNTKKAVTSFIEERISRLPHQIEVLKNMGRYERQCFFCDYLLAYLPETKIRSFNFPANFQKSNPFDFGFRTRKQFCVVDQNIIKTVNGQKWR